MPNNKLKFALLLIVTVILTLGFSISFQNLLAATWQEPTQGPPDSNIFPPVYNESGSATQVLINNKPVGITNSLLITGGNLIVNTGNVGIGVTTPTDKLSVNGIIRATDVCTTGGVCLSASGGGGGGQWSTDGNNIYNNNTGNVGIGTTNPLAPLTISSVNQPDLLIEARSGAAQIRFQNTNRWWELGSDNVPDLFYIGVQSGTSEDSKLVITPTGNVGIGTTNPTQKLDVAGQIRATDVCTTGGKCLSGDSWVNVSTSDTNNFDVNCEYQFTVGGTTYRANVIMSNKIQSISNSILAPTTMTYYSIDSNNKGQARSAQDNYQNTTVDPAPIAVSGIRRLCP